MEADSTGKNRHILGICGHLGREKDNRYEYEHRREHIHEVWDEVQIVIKDNGLDWSLLSHKVINLLTDIENYHDTDDENQSQEECNYKLPEYV
jgi:hypothetical protein